MSLLRFFKDRRASVVPLFALSIIPIVGLIGASVDYSRASAVRAQIQAAADATALAMSKSSSLNTSGFSDTAKQYFLAMMSRQDPKTGAFSVRPDALSPNVTVSYSTTSGSKIVVTGSATVKTMFMGIQGLGITEIPVSASSTATWGNNKLRVALVLDNTGSMSSSGKITALKTATHNLLTQLQTAATKDGDVYVSIVPFAKDVNVGASNSSQSWINWTQWEAPPANSTPSSSVGPGSSCPYSTNNNGFQCTTGPATGSATTSTVPTSGTYKGYICPSVDNGHISNTLLGRYYNGCYDSVQQSKTVSSGSNASCGTQSNCSCSGSGSSRACTQTYYDHTWLVNAHSTWNGCVTDRDQNFDAQNTSPAAGTLFLAEQYQYCNASLLPQTYDWTALNARVDAMSPNGSTNQTIGLVWGWQSLTQSAPLNAPALDPAYQYQQVIILLTDGLNTQDRWYGNGSATSTQVDNRTRAACSNIKNAGITIYTVQVNTGGDPTSTLLQDCASNTTGTTDHFFLLTSSQEIISTFSAIGTNLSQLRISQ
jgi:Flp pilus assembly protein TadG